MDSEEGTYRPKGQVENRHDMRATGVDVTSITRVGVTSLESAATRSQKLIAYHVAACVCSHEHFCLYYSNMRHFQ